MLVIQADGFLCFWNLDSLLFIVAHERSFEHFLEKHICVCICIFFHSRIRMRHLCPVYIKDELSIRSDHWRLPPPLTSFRPCLPAFKRSLQDARLQGRSLPYLVLKLAGCGCPSYKDKKSYSSSTAKDWKTIWILLPSSATITQVQFAPFGYPYGKPGLSIVPFRPFKVPPQVWIKPGMKENKH